MRHFFFLNKFFYTKVLFFLMVVTMEAIAYYLEKQSCTGSANNIIIVESIVYLN